jgi:hypothetical protein
VLEMNSRKLIIFILLLLLVACGSGQDEEATATPGGETVATAAPVDAGVDQEEPTEPAPPEATAGAEPTEMPQAEPTTETESEATPVPDPTSVPEPPATEASGRAGFQDNLAVADRFVLELSGISAPPDGQVFQGWLIGDDGTVISIGQLSVSAAGEVELAWNSPDSENLISRVSQFQVTLEPVAGSENPTGQLLLAGELAGDALDSARRLFVNNEEEPATPRDIAFAVGLIAQTGVALQHVQNAINAAAIGALPEMRSHLEHVVNILEGATGPRFGDHNGNGNAENPGDGFGVLGYTEQIASLLGHQPSVVDAAASVQVQGAVIQDMCLEILGLQDAAAANEQLGDLKELADQFLADSISGLYQATQSAVSFEFTVLE